MTKKVFCTRISSNQRKVLNKLAAGWYLDGCGKDGMGGWCWTDGRKGFRVSVKDMNFLFCNSLIELQNVTCEYQITDAGRLALEGNET